MNEARLKQLVADGIDAEREFKAAETRLKSIKRQLLAEAESRTDEHLPTDGGGASWIAVADDGSAARVTFPARKLKSAIDPKTKDGKSVIEKLATALDELFEKRTVYAPRDGFRAAVRRLFRKPEAEAIIKKCETDSQPSVAFETVNRVEQLAA